MFRDTDVEAMSLTSREAEHVLRGKVRMCKNVAIVTHPLFKLRNSDLIETSISEYGSASSSNFPIQLGPIRATWLIEAANLTLIGRYLNLKRVTGFRVRDRSRGRYATPADFLLHDGTSYRGLRVRHWGLGFVHRSRAIFCRPRAKPKLKSHLLQTAVGGGHRRRRHGLVAVRADHGHQHGVELAAAPGRHRGVVPPRAGEVLPLPVSPTRIQGDQGRGGLGYRFTVQAHPYC
jgi:hypothetical protein